MKNLLKVAVLIFVFALPKISYALKPLEMFILDQRFYDPDFSELTVPQRDILKFEYPTWLAFGSNQVGLDFEYDGVLRAFDGPFKGTKIYDYYYQAYGIYHPKDFSFLEDQAVGVNFLRDYFQADVVQSKSNINIKDVEDLVSPRLAYSFGFLRHFRIGASLNYYDFNFPSNRSFWDLNYDFLSQYPEYGLAVGARRVVDDLSSDLNTFLTLSSYGTFNFKWFAENVKHKNEIYLLKDYAPRCGHEIILKLNYSPQIFNDVPLSSGRGILTYEYRQGLIGAGILYDLDEREEKGPVKLVGGAMPSGYEDLVKKTTANIDIKYSQERYGLKVWSSPDRRRRHTITLSFLRGDIDLKASGDAVTRGFYIEPLLLRGDARIRQDQIGGFYTYAPSSWQIDFGVKNIAISSLGGSIYYRDITSSEGGGLTGFDTLRLWNVSLGISKRFKIAGNDFNLSFGIEQYVPSPKEDKKKSSSNPAPSPAPPNPSPSNGGGSGQGPSAPSEEQTPLYKYLLNTGFVGTVKIVYFF